MSAAKTVAIVPHAVLRRWDAVAVLQLAAEVSRLAAENEELEQRVRWAEQSADMWQYVAEIEREGHQVGITQEGHVVAVQP